MERIFNFKNGVYIYRSNEGNEPRITSTEAQVYSTEHVPLKAGEPRLRTRELLRVNPNGKLTSLISDRFEICGHTSLGGKPSSYKCRSRHYNSTSNGGHNRIFAMIDTDGNRCLETTINGKEVKVINGAITTGGLNIPLNRSFRTLVESIKGDIAIANRFAHSCEHIYKQLNDLNTLGEEAFKQIRRQLGKMKV